MIGLAGVTSVAASETALTPGTDLPTLEIPSSLQGATNSVVAAIAADLQRVKARIDGAVIAMSNSVAANPKDHSAKVLKLADEIAALGTNNLGDASQLMKQAEALVKKYGDSVAKARKGASDPGGTPAVRDIYGQLLPGLELELGRLIDAKATVARIRMELLRQAEGLRQSADAIPSPSP